MYNKNVGNIKEHIESRLDQISDLIKNVNDYVYVSGDCYLVVGEKYYILNKIGDINILKRSDYNKNDKVVLTISSKGMLVEHLYKVDIGPAQKMYNIKRLESVSF